MELTEPFEAEVVAVAHRAELADAEAHLFALHVAAGLRVTGGLVDADFDKAGLPLCSAQTQQTA